MSTTERERRQNFQKVTPHFSLVATSGRHLSPTRRTPQTNTACPGPAFLPGAKQRATNKKPGAVELNKVHTIFQSDSHKELLCWKGRTLRSDQGVKRLLLSGCWNPVSSMQKASQRTGRRARKESTTVRGSQPLPAVPANVSIRGRKACIFLSLRMRSV